MSSPVIQFKANPAIQERASLYADVTIDTAKALKSWKKSLFSFEWMNSDGGIKSFDALSEKEQPKRQEVEDAINNGKPLAKPVLGIGIMDNIEIGMGRAEFLTAALHGQKTIPVHVLRSNLPDFKSFIVEEKS